MPPSDSETTRWFVEEVQPHEAPLRSYLRRSLSSLADVDDLMQETYARVLRARAQGEIRSVRGLLFATARNAVRDLFRRRAVAPTSPIEDSVESCVLMAGPGVDEIVSRQQEVELLAEAIASLPDRPRTVLALRKFEGLPQKEIAARLGIAEHTVELHLMKAMRGCQKFFAQKGAIPPRP